MPILYALIAREKSVLAEYTSSSGNFPTVTRVLLTKVTTETDNLGITFLCMADSTVKPRIAYTFLDDIKVLWRNKYREREQNALAFAMNETFGPVLRQRMEYFNTNPASDALTRVQSQIDSVKEVMVENIEKVLEREEKLDLLVEKTQNLNMAASTFRGSTRKLRNEMLYRKIRYYLLFAFIIGLVILVITMIACGVTFDNCKK